MGGLVFELIRGPILVAEQLGFFCSQLRGSQNDVARVELATVAIAGERGLHNSLA